MPKAKPLTKEQVLLAMKMTKSNKAAARYLNCSYIHYKGWAKQYVEFEGGRNLFEIHKNQSGKGIQISSGTILKPNIPIETITSSGTTVTIRAKEVHGIVRVVPGTQITVSGCNESAYNGTFDLSIFTALLSSSALIPTKSVLSASL
jgi:hypothetical protein